MDSPLRRMARRHFYSKAMRISVDIQLDNIVKGLDDLQRNQIPYAVASTLTATAKDVQAAEVHEIRDSFDRPTPATLNSIYVRPATKMKWEATVGIKNFLGKGNSAEEYLAAQIEGGQRQPKRFERALINAGIMPAGYYAVHCKGVPLDQYGNVSRSLIVQLLSYFKAFPEQGYSANMTDKRKAALAKGKKGKQGVAYFVAFGDGWLRRGIWARYTFAHGSAVKPILMFVRGASYEKRFDYFYTAETTINRVFDAHLRRRWAEAWATARKA